MSQLKEVCERFRSHVKGCDQCKVQALLTYGTWLEVTIYPDKTKPLLCPEGKAILMDVFE